MASSIIPYKSERSYSIETVTASQDVTLTWTSTSNPYCSGIVNIARPGWKPVSIGFSTTGGGATNIVPYRFFLNGEDIQYGFRMYDNTPSTLTQNGVSLVVTYIRLVED